MMDPKKNQRSFLCHFAPTLCFLYAAIFMGSVFMVTEYKQTFLGWGVVDAILHTRGDNVCKAQCRTYGTEALPRGIVSGESDFEMRPLWGEEKKKNPKPMNLLAMAVGIKQKESVNTIVKKFPSSDFVIMLFHYDSNVNDWRDLEWSDHAIHVAAANQTKWWFAKRFLHPDIVSEYAYIFLWDEDLGVQNFHAGRYISIIKEEGLEISQPGLDPDNSELHHHLTARDKTSTVHRRVYKKIGPRQCDENSTAPPCTGFVEMMAPVFSRASWRCVWHMIQNDLVHGWGLDFELGHCAQGDRTKNIGIVDSEYIIHYGLPTLGGSADNKTTAEETDKAAQASSSEKPSGRSSVRKQSYLELERFKNRWRNAIKGDNCWVDPFQLSSPKQQRKL